MKKNKISLLVLLLSCVFVFTACEDTKYNTDPDPNEGKVDKENATINTWIHKEMSFKYYWNDKVPALSSLDINTKPNDFFFNTLYRYKLPKGDRFSHLENDGEFFYTKTADTSKSKNDLGFEFMAYQDTKTGSITLLVVYIKKGSNADKQGLKRGDWIHTVDNTKLNPNNYLSLILSGKASYKLQFYNRTDLDLQTTNNYIESPVHHSEILRIGGKRIGYIVYNSFVNGKTNESLEYALEMNDVLKSFEGQIDELILDLRYNGGGRVLSGNYIASAIVPNRDTSKGMIYTKRAYNKDYDSSIRKYSNYKQLVAEYFHDNISDDKRGGINAPIPRLNMKRLYVITSKHTASASEQIINGLRAYIGNVEIVGETTTGKNMESYPIKDESNKDNKWVLYPLTSVSYNSKANSPEENDYSNGFQPTIGGENHEIEYIGENVYQFGDVRERLLSFALENIMGTNSRMKRSLDIANEGNAKQIGSSLDRKPSEMIIDIPSEK